MDTGTASTGSMRSPVMPVQPPRKKKTGLVVGVVLGSFALVVTISALAVYFLWWQAPENRLNRAISMALKTDRMATRSHVKIAQNGLDMSMVIESATNGDKGKITANLKLLMPHSDQETKITVDAVIDGEGTLYVKTQNLKAALSMLIKTALTPPLLRDDQKDESALLRSLEDQFVSQAEPVVEGIDGQWLKLSVDDIRRNTGLQKASCFLNSLKHLSNPGIRAQIAERYIQHRFLKARHVVHRNGLVGVELDFSSATAQMNRKAFLDSLKTITGLRDIGNCLHAQTDSTGDGPRDTNFGTMILWLQGDQLKKLELNGQDSDVDSRVALAVEFESGSSDKIDIPTEARGLQEINNQLQEVGHNHEAI